MARCWKYKAYDCQFQSHEGLVLGNGLEEVALRLRQRGLQLLELTSVSHSEYNTQLKLACKVKSLHAESTTHQVSPDLQSHVNYVQRGVTPSRCLLIFVTLLLIAFGLHRYIALIGN